MNYKDLKPITMDIKILGTGCSKCKSLYKTVCKAAEELELDAAIEKVEDIQKIMEYGIMNTPGLVINDKVIFSGRVPKMKEIKNLLSNN